jgi:ribonucleoside-triphosphate reductase
MAWADSNFFVSKDVTSLSNCCRLISDVKNLGYFNSIGGTALEVGSIKVNTVNLVRIAYENDKENYLKALREKITLCCKTLDVVRHIIERNVEKGLLPNYDLKIINIKSQYNTIGVIGIYEACDKYGLIEVDEFGNHYYTEEGLKFAEDILATITEVKNEFAQDKDYMINIEQIPAERAASILQHKNKVFFPAEKYEKPLIGNQWLPLAVKCTLQEKIRVSAALDKA